MTDRYESIRQITANYEASASMESYTSFRCGGKADLLVTPESREELSRILQTIRENGIPAYILGNGSNVLVRDGGYRGVIVRLAEPFSEISVRGTEITAGAGALLSAVSRAAADHDLAGLEFASGIPGSVGGGIYMNAGAYDGEIKKVLKEAEVLTPDGVYITRKAEELDLSYRHSALMENGEILVSAVFALKAGDPEEIRAKIADFTERRTTKQPLQYPSCGSFFKRPEGYFAGKLIQDAGLKGLSVGGAQVSELHAGFLINTGGATATDVITLMHLVQAAVLEDAGVLLEPEVRIIGEDVETDL